MTAKAKSAVQVPLFSDTIIKFRIIWFVLYTTQGEEGQYRFKMKTELPHVRMPVRLEYNR
jgi:hypothetical protein